MNNLRHAADEYLAMRRALGYSMRGQDRLLASFLDHIDQVGAASITTDLAVAWATNTRPGTNRAQHNARLTVVRMFATHVHAWDPTTEIPPADLMPFHYRRVTPHLFTPQDIDALMRAAGDLKPRLRALTHMTLIGLLATTGMRVGEACGLDRRDVDCDAGILTIRAGKLGKAREVPLHPTTSQALRHHDQQRDQLCPMASTAGFFVNTRGRRQAANKVPEVFARLCHAAGVGPAPGGRHPRVHDLRHTFCVATILDWCRTGVDVHASLPLLSTYLGHVDPAATYWYLQATPELLALAADRLDRFLGDLP